MTDDISADTGDNNVQEERGKDLKHNVKQAVKKNVTVKVKPSTPEEQ